MGTTTSSPGFLRTNASSIAAVTTTTINAANTTRRVFSTLVSADTWRSHRGTPRAIVNEGENSSRTVIRHRAKRVEGDEERNDDPEKMQHGNADHKPR